MCLIIHIRTTAYSIYCIYNLFHFLSSLGIYGPDEGWASTYPECKERNQSPVNIVDKDTTVSTEYQEMTMEGFDTESSNKTSMKNTGKTGRVTLVYSIQYTKNNV